MHNFCDSFCRETGSSVIQSWIKRSGMTVNDWHVSHGCYMFVVLAFIRANMLSIIDLCIGILKLLAASDYWNTNLRHIHDSITLKIKSIASELNIIFIEEFVAHLIRRSASDSGVSHCIGLSLNGTWIYPSGEDGVGVFHGPYMLHVRKNNIAFQKKAEPVIDCIATLHVYAVATAAVGLIELSWHHPIH